MMFVPVPFSPKSPAFGVLISTLVLSIIGLVFVFEASTAEALTTFADPYYFLKQQAFRLMIGWGALLAAWFVPYKVWQKTALLWYVGGVILLLLVLIPGIGLELNGAHRWLSLGGFVIQPVEILKFGLVMYFAQWLSQHQRVGPFMFLTGLPALLILLQPDLGSLLIVVGIATVLFFLAGGSTKALAGLATGGILILVVAIMLSPYRLKRVTTFLNPESDPLGSSFHVRQITLALGNGGWFGQGLGNSRQKYAYIPEASSDSIFAIVAEEVGFVGALVLLLLFTGYFWSSFRIVKKLTNPFALFVGMGMLSWVLLQTILNLSAVVALVPLTGVPLPFFSYGGSAQIMILFATGIICRAVQEK